MCRHVVQDVILHIPNNTVQYKGLSTLHIVFKLTQVSCGLHVNIRIFYGSVEGRLVWCGFVSDGAVVELSAPGFRWGMKENLSVCVRQEPIQEGTSDKLQQT
jgi:hypothetical protein